MLTMHLGKIVLIRRWADALVGTIGIDDPYVNLCPEVTTQGTPLHCFLN